VRDKVFKLEIGGLGVEAEMSGPDDSPASIGL
jgi:hypothetical protein